MHKCGVDPKVRKTLVRNVEQRVRPTARMKVVHDVGNAPSVEEPARLQIDTELDQPTLCSSELLANYLSGVKNSLPPPLSSKDLCTNKSEMSTKITKKLNFHINDRMYKDLIELNASMNDQKNKKERPTSSVSSVKRDMEPNIEDFFEEEIDFDMAPKIPVVTLKFKPIRRVDDGDLHKLVASFENL